ncbi:MAG: hypothetical protein HY910_05440, partial [Desulfarculus sp.]|nr:hypothetical protein [Desulfarculus sp.]
MATESSVDPGVIADLVALAAERGYSLNQLLATSQTAPKRKRGRPKGSGIDDSVALERMASLMVMNQAKSAHAAACMVAPRQLGQSEAATIHRLMAKFKNIKAELMKNAKKKMKTSLIELLIETRKGEKKYLQENNKLLPASLGENITSILSRVCGENLGQISSNKAQLIWANSINSHLPNQPINLTEAARDPRLQESFYRNISTSLFPDKFLDDHSVRAIERILECGVNADAGHHLIKFYFPFISTEHPPAWFVEAFFIVARRIGISNLMVEGLFLTRDHLIKNPWNPALMFSRYRDEATYLQN